ncbi:MAG: chitobiase/beta-hexosaminidase C-terminal domain-containing protein [Maribacter sp.]
MSRKIAFIVVFYVLLYSCKEAKDTKFVYTTEDIFELAPPRIEVDSLLFRNSARVSAEFNMQDSQIRYTTDGSPVTESSTLYTEPLRVDGPAKFVFSSFHPAYKKSKEVHTRLIQLKYNVSNAKVTLKPNPHSNYEGNGAKGLVDLKKGTLQFRGDKNWLGFQSDQVLIRLEFNEETPITKLVVSSLNDHGSWIFGPKGIEVRSNGLKIGELKRAVPQEMEPKRLKLLDISITEGTYKNIEIQIDLIEVIPDWHQGKGTVPFLFIDEILVE